MPYESRAVDTPCIVKTITREISKGTGCGRFAHIVYNDNIPENRNF
jgi:hypothetical protein